MAVISSYSSVLWNFAVRLSVCPSACPSHNARMETLNLVVIFSIAHAFSRNVKGQCSTSRMSFPIDAARFHFTVHDVRRRSALLR